MYHFYWNEYIFSNLCMLYSKVQGQVHLKCTSHKNSDINGGSRVPDGLTTITKRLFNNVIELDFSNIT